MGELTVFWDESFLDHEPPAGEFEAEWTGRLATREPHPDRKARVRNIKHIVEQALAEYVEWATVDPITDEQLYRVHDPVYVDDFETFCASGGGRLTAETGANEATPDAARHAAGAARMAAEAALADGMPYALVRPSGHHAQPAQANGFCFFNNVAIAAEHLLMTGRTDRIAILDWDVHHGDGTQEVFYDRDDVLFISLHNNRCSLDRKTRPQSGDINERGVGEGYGYNYNVPLPPGTGDVGYAYAFEQIVDPAIEAFDPDVLLVSAGQDPGTVDPLGRSVVTKDGFEDFGRRARDLAVRHADGNLALIQEGGYQISHLAYATLGVLEGILGVQTGIDDPFAWLEEDIESAKRAVDRIVAAFAVE